MSILFWRKPVAGAVSLPAVYVTLRRGMWLWIDVDDRENGVRFAGTGILNSVLPNGELDVHMVDKKGETSEMKTVAPQWVRQALLKEIPEARRPNQTVADKFGYN